MNQLFTIAETSLKQNIVSTSQGRLLTAGKKQFKTLWVRDFCFAIKGLLLLGEDDLVKNQLLLFLNHQNADGLLARGMDVVDPKLRVACASFGVSLPLFEYEDRPLKAEYFGEHRTPAVDSNVLVLLGIFDWTEKTGDNFFFEEKSDILQPVFEYLLGLMQNGLLSQPPYSDWQDSARRQGVGFYLNLLFYKLLKRLDEKNLNWNHDFDLASFGRSLFDTFFDPTAGLFREKPNLPQFALESQLWCIEENLFNFYLSATEHWSNLKRSALWNPLPGRPIWPRYHPSEISWTTKCVGLRHYHDDLYWSWLISEALKVAYKMNDRSAVDQLTEVLTLTVTPHGGVHEVYQLRSSGLKPFKSLLYSSEFPFSWGAAKLLEALSFRPSAQ